jgi:hypothetical protein
VLNLDVISTEEWLICTSERGLILLNAQRKPICQFVGVAMQLVYRSKNKISFQNSATENTHTKHHLLRLTMTTDDEDKSCSVCGPQILTYCHAEGSEDGVSGSEI